jgi:AraC-like DNA-binding protein
MGTLMYREFPPPPDLAAHVACVWTSVSGGGAILPDGCVDLVWDGERLVVAGPATGPSPAGVAPGRGVFGVRFRLGMAGAALGLPADELADRTVPLAAVWGDEAVERVELGGPAVLLDVVRERMGPLDPLARAAALGLARPGARVAAVGAALGVSERQLRRRVEAAVGYSPKTLARILRFQRFLRLAGGAEAAAAGHGGVGAWPGGAAPAGGGAHASSAGGDGLARLALAAGYADQAHLTREARRLAHRTPAALVRDRAVAAGERLP